MCLCEKEIEKNEQRESSGIVFQESLSLTQEVVSGRGVRGLWECLTHSTVSTSAL